MNLSDGEKTFILHGVEMNFRVDGREREDYRPMELELDVVSHAFGSARLRLANTDVLVAVKIEIANATPNFEGRGGEDLAIELSNCLSSAYSSNEAIDLTKLCIMKGRKCWKLYVDILLLEVGGNLYDAVSIAVKSALWNTQVPKIKALNVDGSNVDIQVLDDIHSCTKLDAEGAPVMVTICKIGEKCVIDPDTAEEQCSSGAVVVAVSKGCISTILQTGTGSFHPDTLKDCLKLGVNVAANVEKVLLETLEDIQPNQDIGFLK